MVGSDRQSLSLRFPRFERSGGDLLLASHIINIWSEDGRMVVDDTGVHRRFDSIFRRWKPRLCGRRGVRLSQAAFAVGQSAVVNERRLTSHIACLSPFYFIFVLFCVGYLRYLPTMDHVYRVFEWASPRGGVQMFDAVSLDPLGVGADTCESTRYLVVARLPSGE